MAQTPPDPVHILHNTGGPVTALTTVKINEGAELFLVSGSDRGVLTIWDINAFRPSKSWQAHQSTIVWLSGLENLAGWLISHGRKESVIIWNPQGNPVYHIPINHEGFCKCDVWTTILSYPVEKSSIKVVEISRTDEDPTISATDIRELKMDNNEGAVMAIKLLDRDTLLAAYESGCIALWKNTTPLHRTRVEGMPTCLEHHSHRNEILLGTSSETLHIFSVGNLEHLKAIPLTNPGLNAIALRLSDSRLYATAGWDKRIRLFSARSHKKLCVLQLHDVALNSLVFISGHCGLLAAGGSDALISLWDLYGDGGKQQNT